MSWAHAQEYIHLTDDNLAYDVDVVVFARNLSQPSATTMTNRFLDIDLASIPLLKNNDDLPLFKPLIPENPAESSEGSILEVNEDDNWQVPLSEQNNDTQALVWLLLNQNSRHPIIERLNINPSINPLFHQQWRQPATDFLAPEYIAISSIKPAEELFYEVGDEPIDPINEPFETTSASTEDNDDTSITENQPVMSFPDFSFDGMVSFSKQRYTHFTVKMNFYRQDAEGQQLIYNINQKTRIELGQWQYFDHQQFGVIVKVVAVDNPLNQEQQP